MNHWSERQSYSLGADCDIARISGFDDHGQEHWMEIETGKGFAARRLAAIETIQAAIEAGHEAGEVVNEG